MSFERQSGLVSVIVTCFNNGQYVKECLHSLINQTYRNNEIIIIDDKSTDNSVQQVKELIKSYQNQIDPERLIFVELPRNVGCSGTVTTGFFLSRGEFIAIHDMDDISHPERIQRQVEYLQEHPEIGAVGSNYASFNEGLFDQKQEASFWLAYGVDNIRNTYALGGHCVSVGTMLFRGSVFDELGGFSNKVIGAEDWEFICRYIANGVEVDNIPVTLYYYRNHNLQRS
ncbi:glycosyltransferase [Fodinisporobacter ferrooxydans]|uniref:Glycosyltransferase n=1 Tax=Fodinisporobacter ferrooxydans TaxID=2901836 RepID=A0ABY4CJN1_9BACL|nr:glycosyltransferase [Alicyclobacillaceae bacterium MYW30-H2]